MGTRIFLGGGIGYVSWQGTQFNTTIPERNGIPTGGSRTLALIGDMKQMDAKFVRGLDIYGYGTSLAIGVGIPIPILNKDIMQRAAITDDQIYSTMYDYSVTSRSRPALRQYSYAEMKRGIIEYEGHGIRTSPLSSYKGARDVAGKLKDWIEHSEFELTVPSMPLPKEGKVQPLEIR
jgi:uncharacterized protein (DUF39 family)